MMAYGQVHTVFVISMMAYGQVHTVFVSKTRYTSLVSRVANGSVSIRVHGIPGTRTGTGTVKEKVEPDTDP